MRQLARRFFSTRVYQSVPVDRLLNAYVILRLCRSPTFIRNMETLATTGQRLLGDRLFFWTLKQTLGRHFTAGESLDEAAAAVSALEAQGFRSALGYMAEFLEDLPDETAYDAVADVNVATLRLNTRRDPDFFFAIKFSGLVALSTLKKTNEAQKRLETVFREDLPSSPEIHLKFQTLETLRGRLARLVPDAPAAQVEQFLAKIPRLSPKSRPDALNLHEWQLGAAGFNLLNKPMNEDPLWRRIVGLTDEDLARLHRLEHRLDRILAAMRETPGYLLMDAEQSFVQLAIDSFAEQLQFRENFGAVRPAVFNTVQNYLLSAPTTVADELAKQDFFGPSYPVLLKFVRGAYHKQELALEAATGEPVVFKSRDQTDATYNANCLAVLTRLTPASRLFVASHNDHTVDLVGAAIDAHPEAARVRRQVYFGTLLGLNDRLAYSCLAAGRTTVKFMPFGERHLTLPYMVRRAYETKDLLRRNGAEVGAVGEELWARLRGR